MPTTATQIDPLSGFLRSTAEDRELHPIPLVATRIDVSILGGLAIVTTERTFRNRESRLIEAMMTFPVPVDATLCALVARIGKRTLNAVAQARSRARETYERAVGEGKAAVLHEELLKGVHMLSVAPLAAGAEIAVSDTWTAPLSFVDATPRLRIPTTVGEIYGQSPLSRSDDLVTGAVVHKASIGIVCDSGKASLLGAGARKQQRFDVCLDTPIDIVVDGWSGRTLEGVAADGRKVTLEIAPAPKTGAAADIDVLFDHSGSMAERATGDVEFLRSKFEVATAALLAACKDRLKPSDRIRLWEFNDQVDFVGAAGGADVPALVRKLRSPDGGTEIGRAFNAVIKSGANRNTVIVTDGKSWALDVQGLARAGLRVCAVLIGHDALEATIGHLAGMTGGQVFVATGSDATPALAAALDAARGAYLPAAPISGNPVRIEAFRRGARVVATWGIRAKGKASVTARQIAATAAALAVASLPEPAAAKLAESEGIVTHLTSLVLVDEAEKISDTIPASRKIRLSAPNTVRQNQGLLMRFSSAAYTASDRVLCCEAPMREMGDPSLWARRSELEPPAAPAAAPPPVSAVMPRVDLRRLLDRIDWDADPEALRRGMLSGLPHDVRSAIRAAADIPEMIAFARSLGIDPLVAVLALFAHAASTSSRSAERLARAVLGTTASPAITNAVYALGL